MCFNFLLLYFVSRSYLILRPRNKSDPDPKLLTVLLRIWPWMFLVVVANLTFLVFIAGLAGWLVFPSLLLCGVVDLLALFYFCSSIKQSVDAERGEGTSTAESRAFFEKENRDFIYMAALGAIWAPNTVGSQPQKIFLVSGIASLTTKVFVLIVVVALAGSGHLTKVQPQPFLLFCFNQEDSFRLNDAGLTTCKFSDPQKPCFQRLSTTSPSTNLTHEMRTANAVSAAKEAVTRYKEALTDFIHDNPEPRLQAILKNQFKVTVEYLSQIESSREEFNETLKSIRKSQFEQKVRICEESETGLRVGLLTGLLLLTTVAFYAICRLHEIADYRVLTNIQ